MRQRRPETIEISAIPEDAAEAAAPPGAEAVGARATRTAVLLSFLERYTTVTIYAVSNMVLSRLLTPHDTGLFTLGFALTVMIGTLRDFGVSTYVIQERELTDLKWRSALGVSAVTCLVVLAGVVVAAFVAGRLYRDPGVTAVMLISGLTLLMIPLNAMVLAWLRREMRYGALYRIALAGALGQTLVTIGLAWRGAGAMSMAWGSVANSAVILLGSFRLRPRGFGLMPTLSEWRPIASLGVYSTIGTVCNEITPNGADIFLGRTAGLAALGQFSKGGSLVSFVNQALTNAVLPVVLSVFAHLRRSGEPLDRALPRALALWSGVAWPAFGGLIVVAAPAIRLLFGNQWTAAIQPARWIVGAAMLTALTALHGAVYQACGAMRARMLVQLWVTPIQLLLLFVASHGTLTQMAMGVLASAAVEFVPSQLVVNQLCGTSLGRVVWAVMPSGLVTLVTVGAALAAEAWVAPSADRVLLPLVVAVACGGVGWVLGLVVTRHSLAEEALGVCRPRDRLSGRPSIR